MPNFDLIKNISRIYSKKNYLKDRNLSVLEFNSRVLQLSRYLDIPILERLNYAKIVFDNIDEFISIRLPECRGKRKQHNLDYIEMMYRELDVSVNMLLDDTNLRLPTIQYDTTASTNNFFSDGGLYYVYINQFDQYGITPCTMSPEEIEAKLKFITPSLEIKYSFLIRSISDKSFNYVYSGENTAEILSEIKSVINIKKDNIFNFIQTTCNNPIIMKRFINDMGLTIDSYIHVSPVVIQLPEIVNTAKKYKPIFPPHQYKPFVGEYTRRSYITSLLNRDIMIRNPYDSYQQVIEFIYEMCLSSDIVSIFISLYRVGGDSRVVEALLLAKEYGKNVYVYVEPTARGDEARNVSLIERLLSVGINVSCNYFNYKVHAKIFCAVSKSGLIYTHVGTGNYNEHTAKIYTDTHLLTTNPEITLPVFELFQSLFQKKRHVPSSITPDSKVHVSPFNLRHKIIDCINDEIEKGELGSIMIKCNSLCDPHIIDKLYEADKAGVTIRLIIRSACSILPEGNIEIRSKVGRFLEHDRIYIFGDSVYISSADLLLRNIDKRVEVFCKITDARIRVTLRELFFNIWVDPNIYNVEMDSFE